MSDNTPEGFVLSKMFEELVWDDSVLWAGPLSSSSATHADVREIVAQEFRERDRYVDITAKQAESLGVTAPPSLITLQTNLVVGVRIRG